MLLYLARASKFGFLRLDVRVKDAKQINEQIDGRDFYRLGTNAGWQVRPGTKVLFLHTHTLLVWIASITDDFIQFW